VNEATSQPPRWLDRWPLNRGREDLGAQTLDFGRLEPPEPALQSSGGAHPAVPNSERCSCGRPADAPTAAST